MTNEVTQAKLQILTNFLNEQDIPERLYSIGEYCEESICIEANGDNWVVYAGERGNHYGEKVFSEFSDAACHLLSRVAYSHSEEESLAIAFKDYLEKCETDVSVTSSKSESFFSLFNNIFNRIENNSKMRGFFIAEYVVTALIAVIISSFVSYRTAIRNSDSTIVDLMSRRLEFVEENDSLEEMINSLNNTYEEQNAEIVALNSKIDDLENQLNAQQSSDVKDNEIKELKAQLSKKEQELAETHDEINKLQIEYASLQKVGYEEYIRSKTSTPSVLLKDIEVLNNNGINTDYSGDVALDGNSYAYYLSTNNSNEAYIEYKLDGEYTMFIGKVYISKWVYEEYDNSDDRIKKASLCIEVKHENDGEYQELASVSGLSADSEPVEISGGIIGARSLRITIRNGAEMRGDTLDSIIRLGDPILHKSE